MINERNSSNYNLKEAADNYAQDNVKKPYYDISNDSWVVRYTESGMWTWTQAKDKKLAMSIYKQLFLQKREFFIQSHFR